MAHQSRFRYGYLPKRDVASTIAVLLQTGRLRIARDLKESETLLRELLSFRVKISLTGHDTYEAWREQEHDDLVLAVGLAAWLFEKGQDGYIAFVEEELREAEKVILSRGS
ncbi:MAG: hypothetical protein ACXVRU_14570 [Gaiellaceae bacterium]